MRPSGSPGKPPAGGPGSGPVPGSWAPRGSWPSSLQVTLPADRSPGTPGRCSDQPYRPGWSSAENARAGAVGFVPPPDNAQTSRLAGYLDRTAVGCGDTVGLHLSGPAGPVVVQAFRIGAYPAHARARLVWTSGELPVSPQPVPAPDPITHQIRPQWPVTTTVSVTADWPPGFYLLVPRAVRGPVGRAVPLVVRDDTGTEPVLFAASTMTWNAYDDWNGYSLYHGPKGNASTRRLQRAREVTFHRPLAGAGYRQLMTMDLPVVETVEQLGVDVAYTTDTDIDRRPSQLLRHAETVFGGHSEYWTRREYDAVVAARNSGVNLAFLGANNLWWHTRLTGTTADPVGAATGSDQTWPQSQVVWRDTVGDPASRTDPRDLTMLWSQWPEHRDGAAVLGQSHAGIGVHGGYQIMDAPAWILAGTGLRKGSVLPGAVGNEADGFNPRGANPPNLTVIAAGVLQGAGGPVTASAGYYAAPSGAGVFAAGSTDWSCGLQGPCGDQTVPIPTVQALAGITRNVLLAFTHPKAGQLHPSTASVPALPAQLFAELDPHAIGSYGGSESSEGDGTSRHPMHPPGPNPGVHAGPDVGARP